MVPELECRGVDVARDSRVRRRDWAREVGDFAPERAQVRASVFLGGVLRVRHHLGAQVIGMLGLPDHLRVAILSRGSPKPADEGRHRVTTIPSLVLVRGDLRSLHQSGHVSL